VLANLIDDFTARGRSFFTLKDVQEELSDSSVIALKAAIGRLRAKGRIAMPYKGFYVVVPPEHRDTGCLPAEEFIPDLMKHLGEPYYTSLLTAAEYYGAAHQRPQVFQVMVSKTRRQIHCGKVRVWFIFRENLSDIPTSSRNTRTGVMRISTPEATALDLVGYYRHCGGLGNVATVLSELMKNIDAERLIEAAGHSPVAWAQRLGYLLDMVDAKDVADRLAGYIIEKNPNRKLLAPWGTIKGAKSSSRWRLLVNTDVEADEV
jgi:predicted transcriptional regulator of viral defense system